MTDCQREADEPPYEQEMRTFDLWKRQHDGLRLAYTPVVTIKT